MSPCNTSCGERDLESSGNNSHWQVHSVGWKGSFFEKGKGVPEDWEVLDAVVPTEKRVLQEKEK